MNHLPALPKIDPPPEPKPEPKQEELFNEIEEKKPDVEKIDTVNEEEKKVSIVEPPQAEKKEKTKKKASAKQLEHLERMRQKAKEKREKNYPDWKTQMDQQYWDSVNGTTTWKDAIAKVKSDFPKPS